MLTQNVKRHHHAKRRLDIKVSLASRSKRNTGLLPANLPDQPISTSVSTVKSIPSSLWLYIGMTFILTIFVTITVGVACLWNRKRKVSRKSKVASHPWTARYMRSEMASPHVEFEKETNQADVAQTSQKTKSILFLRRKTLNVDPWTSPIAIDYPTAVLTSPRERLSYRDDAIAAAVQINDMHSFDHESIYSGLQSCLTSPTDEKACTNEIGLGLILGQEKHVSIADKYARLMPRQSLLPVNAHSWKSDGVNRERSSNGSTIFLAKAANTSVPSLPSMYSIGEEKDTERRASCTDLLEEIFDERVDASPTNAFTTTMHSIKTNKLHRAIATSGELLTKLVRRSEIRRRQTRSGGALPTYMLESIVTPYPCQASSPDDRDDLISSSPSMNTTLQTSILAMLEDDRRYSPINHVKGRGRRCTASVSAVESQTSSANANPTHLLRAHTVIANTSKTSSIGAQPHMLTAVQRQSEYASPTMQLVELYDVNECEDSICTTDTSFDDELLTQLSVIPT